MAGESRSGPHPRLNRVSTQHKYYVNRLSNTADTKIGKKGVLPLIHADFSKKKEPSDNSLKIHAKFLNESRSIPSPCILDLLWHNGPTPRLNFL